MAHGHGHLAPRRLDLPRYPDRRLHRVGDGLFAEDVEPTGDRKIDDAFMVRGRNDHRAKIRFGIGEGSRRI